MNFLHRNMYVIKRDGRRETVYFDKITRRIQSLRDEIHLTRVNPIQIAQKTISSLHDGITTEELDQLSAGISFQSKYVWEKRFEKVAGTLENLII